MKKHRDLLSVLRANNMRITPARRTLIQFLLNNRSRRVSLKEIQDHLESRIDGVNRSSIYRNLEALKRIEALQELSFPGKGKCFQYIFDRKVHHYFICKACGRSSRGNAELFKRIEQALQEVHGFAKANLSLVFYGECSACRKKSGGRSS
jgi:Fur family transcriptional regulator, ferric uptake regulator